MPELPEVEVVRLGLVPLAGSRISQVEVLDGRALKRHVPLGGSASDVSHGVTLSREEQQRRAGDITARLMGRQLATPARRGKFLWLPLAAEGVGAGQGSAVASSPGTPGGQPASQPAGTADEAILAHLGMSGQLLVRAEDAPDDKHVRIRLWLETPRQGLVRLDFADQRLFGGLALDHLVDGVPSQAGHIAPDPLEPGFDDAAAAERIIGSSAAVKAVLLNQQVLSGVGNIYADEALWQARLHPERPASSISRRKALELVGAVREVFTRSLAEGGTSFDALYVNVEGEAGYFARSLAAYGRAGEPCLRCGTLMRRATVAGRGTTFCPRCQRRG